jgi:hypothetical protein
LITKFRYFESIRDEYPGLFSPIKDEDRLKVVPGFEDGTIDPSDDEEYYGKKSDKDRYKDFIALIKKRNFIETPDSIKINMKGINFDFYMSIYNWNRYFYEFIRSELLGKYLIDGYYRSNSRGVDNNLEGIIEEVYVLVDSYNAFVDFKLKDTEVDEFTFCRDFITIDKLKTDYYKYNI